MANIGFISLGCAKNQVDCERMMYRVQEAGHTVKADIVGSDVVVINTCGFIDSAKAEAIDYILQMGQLKAQGLIGKILALLQIQIILKGHVGGLGSLVERSEDIFLETGLFDLVRNQSLLDGFTHGVLYAYTAADQFDVDLLGDRRIRIAVQVAVFTVIALERELYLAQDLILDRVGCSGICYVVGVGKQHLPGNGHHAGTQGHQNMGTHTGRPVGVFPFRTNDNAHDHGTQKPHTYPYTNKPFLP